jgi:lysozyme
MANWPGDDQVFPLCIDIIKEFEGFGAKPYLDSAGIPTIGNGTIRYPDGKAVAMTDPPVSAAEAEKYLIFEMKDKGAKLAASLEKSATLHQAAAMLSLAYNIGVSAFCSSTVLKKFNVGDIAAAADAFLMWDKAKVKGKLTVIPGLHNRRVRERTIFLTADAAPEAGGTPSAPSGL